MAYSSLREWLEYLKRQDILKEINRPVDLTYEVAALGKKQMENMLCSSIVMELPIH